MSDKETEIGNQNGLDVEKVALQLEEKNGHKTVVCGDRVLGVVLAKVTKEDNAPEGASFGANVVIAGTFTIRELLEAFSAMTTAVTEIAINRHVPPTAIEESFALGVAEAISSSIKNSDMTDESKVLLSSLLSDTLKRGGYECEQRKNDVQQK